MPSFLNEIAGKLLEDHPGIPNERTAKELTESFFRVMRRQLIADGVLYMENIGKLEVKRYKGSDKKSDPKTGIAFKIPARNVVKFTSAPSLVKMLNIGRPAREQVKL